MTVVTSPYAGLAVADWEVVTAKLLSDFPIPESEVLEIVLDCWTSIFNTRIGTAGYQIGKDIFPSPQIMGFFLHELIPLEFENRHPSIWSRDKTGFGKDIVCLTDPLYSCEIKSSSHKSQIFGNRSHAQVGQSSKKDKSGYYIAINFDKSDLPVPKIRRVRLGWIDSTDWQGQASSTGQQARLSADVENYKLKELFTLNVPKTITKRRKRNGILDTETVRQPEVREIAVDE